MSGQSPNALSKELGISLETLHRYRDNKVRLINDRVLQRLCRKFAWGTTEEIRQRIFWEHDLETSLGPGYADDSIRRFHPRRWEIEEMKPT